MKTLALALLVLSGCAANHTIYYTDRLDRTTVESAAQLWQRLGSDLEVVHTDVLPEGAQYVMPVRAGSIEGGEACGIRQYSGTFSWIEIDLGCIETNGESVHDVLAHELGHFIGLDHATALSDGDGHLTRGEGIMTKYCAPGEHALSEYDVRLYRASY